MFPPMTPMGERVQFQCESRELERRTQHPIHFFPVTRLKALISSRRSMMRSVVARRLVRRAEMPDRVSRDVRG